MDKRDLPEELLYQECSETTIYFLIASVSIRETGHK